MYKVTLKAANRLKRSTEQIQSSQQRIRMNEKFNSWKMKLFPEPFSEATQILNESSQNSMYEDSISNITESKDVNRNNVDKTVKEQKEQQQVQQFAVPDWPLLIKLGFKTAVQENVDGIDANTNIRSDGGDEESGNIEVMDNHPILNMKSAKDLRMEILHMLNVIDCASAWEKEIYADQSSISSNIDDEDSMERLSGNTRNYSPQTLVNGLSILSSVRDLYTDYYDPASHRIELVNKDFQAFSQRINHIQNERLQFERDQDYKQYVKYTLYKMRKKRGLSVKHDIDKPIENDMPNAERTVRSMLHVIFSMNNIRNVDDKTKFLDNSLRTKRASPLILYTIFSTLLTEYLDSNLKCYIIALPDSAYSQHALNLNKAVHEKNKKEEDSENSNKVEINDDDEEEMRTFQKDLLNAQNHNYFMCIQEDHDDDTYHFIDLNNN